MHKYAAPILIVLFSMLNISCSSWQDSTTLPSADADEMDSYTTAFPNRDVSDHLKDAQQAIIRIISTSHYNSYVFEKPQIRLVDIQTNKLENIASQQYTNDESTAGTSIILELKNDGKALLITCAHAVNSPDTLISYFSGENYPPNTFVESISIKRRQTNLLFTPSELSNFEIIAEDRLSDLALLSATLNSKSQSQHRSLSFEMGSMDHLRLGSFLYVLGFPKGFPMITRGIASTRALRPHRFFIMDALFNPGISGGLVISSRDNFRNFEWIGMARSATASQETVLIPRPDDDGEGSGQQRIVRPYNDTVFLGQKSRISYGITQAIPISEIRSFLDENSGVVRRNGFNY